MKIRNLIIIGLVALLGSCLYIKLVWGTFGAFLNDCLIRSLIGIVCLVVILVAISLTSKR